MSCSAEYHTWTTSSVKPYQGQSCDCGLKSYGDPSVPSVCPKCKGEGTDDGSKRLLNPTVLNCWPCQGTGIVWGGR